MQPVLSAINTCVRWATRAAVVAWIIAIAIHAARGHEFGAAEAVLGLTVTLMFYPFLTRD